MANFISFFHHSFLWMMHFSLLLIHSAGHGYSSDHTALFIFGDSLFDPGNNNFINTNTSFQANFRPYGETFFTYPTGRFSDGRLIPDFIAEYANLPILPPYEQPGRHQFTYGVNFASGGAGALVQTYQGLVIGLKTQLINFKKAEKILAKQLGEKESKNLLSRAVYLFSIGGNDYVSRNSSVFKPHAEEEFVEMVIGNLTDVVKEIYKSSGGRKFGFVNLAPAGCLPSTRNQQGTGACLVELTVLANLHNVVLSKTLKKLQRRLQDFRYSIFDAYTTLLERIDNPSKYGFKEGKNACCGSGPYRGVYSCGGKRGVKEFKLCSNVSEYVFFDSFHATEMVYQQLAELMWSGSPKVVGPYNMNKSWGSFNSYQFFLYFGILFLTTPLARNPNE